MSHELDINTDATGRQVANFVSARTSAWHGLGTVFATELTVAEALEAAHLARWDVRKLDLYGKETVLTEDGVTTNEIVDPGWRLTVRNNPVTGVVEPLGPVGKGFVHIQNEQHGEFLEALLDMSGARFLTTAGALRGGRQVFYCAKLPEPMMIGGRDRHDLYVTAMNGHDGSLALTVVASPIRVVCANTQAAAMAWAAQKWSARHTSGAHKAIEDARKGLDMTFKFNAAFQAEADRMIDAELTKGEFDKIVGRLFDEKDPRDESPREATNRMTRRATLDKLWVSDTQREIAGTRWAGFNVVTEYVDHFANARAAAHDDKSRARAMAATTGQGFSLKGQAFNAFRVPASASA